MKNSGFTLIELSIVLVIIGLIIGGILLGRDLIAASEVRAQIAQIEKYNSAVNTFHNKYGGIPGDLNIPLANQFGFTVGTGCDGSAAGYRNGDGIIQGWSGGGLAWDQGIGETALFWQDLSIPNLIDGEFPNSGAPAIICSNSANSLTLTAGTLYLGNYFPVGKIGKGNFVYVYPTGGTNWYGLSAATSTNGWALFSNATIPVIQAYNIDKKVDDGSPVTGSILATYLNGNVVQTANAQPTDSTTSCYNTTNNSYSISGSANQGAGLNCALSFKFQ